MKVNEFYKTIGKNYNEVVLCLGKEERVYKYLKKFPETNSIQKISDALNNKDYEEAFREAHNLKGMSINIGLEKLYQVSSDLTESLRNGPTGDVDSLYKATEEEYKKICDLIEQVKED